MAGGGFRRRGIISEINVTPLVDITNIALLPEEVTPGNTIRYVLPTVGLRGRI